MMCGIATRFVASESVDPPAAGVTQGDNMNAPQNRIPYGWRLSKSGSKLVKDRREQAILLTIKQLLAHGETLKGIRAELIKRGVLDGESPNEA
jgi:hypothetical protein